jgi:glucose-1-phosphate cytidylyltransferase
VKVIILAGGLGTRLQEATADRPKPMVEIGGRPILWHIMKSYAHHGFREFVLALGYGGEIIKVYFLNYAYLSSSFSVDLRAGRLETHEGSREDWLVHLIDTGLATQTGGRIKRLGSWLRDGTFLMTYGDGVANLDLRQLVEFHRRNGKLATVTAVRPPALRRPRLRRLYARLLQHATLCLHAEDVLTFLGRKLHGGFAGEILNDWKRRWPGAR